MKKIFFLIAFSFLFCSYTKAQYVLYGTTPIGGVDNKGTIFSYNPLTNSQTVLFSFNGLNGNGPEGYFLVISDSILYGTTAWGGIHNMGTMFSFNVKTKIEKVLIDFNGTNGYMSDGGNNIIRAKDGLLYGTTSAGGTNNAGVIFSYDITTGKDSTRFNFDTNTTGVGPYEALFQDNTTGFLYGVNKYGGANRYGGVLYRFNPTNNNDTVLINFGNGNGIEPVSQLMHASNGLLYGITEGGGDSNEGIIYSYDIASNTFKNEYNFYNRKGGGSNGNYLIQLSDGLIYGMTENGGIDGGGVLYGFNPANDSENVLVNFDYNNGGIPQGGLIQDPDNGLIYGMTEEGGSNNTGVFFSYDTMTSTYIKIFEFTGPNGASPLSGLTLVKDTSITTGVDKINERLAFKIFPNPNNGIFTISLGHAVPNNSGSASQTNVEIYNVLGQKVFGEIRQLADDNLIDISSQPNGIYFYRVLEKNGSLIGEGKVIIQK